VSVDAPAVYYTSDLLGNPPPYVVYVTVTNFNSFAIPKLQVSAVRLFSSVTLISKPAQANYSTTTILGLGLVVNIFNLPPQGTVSLSYQFPGFYSSNAPPFILNDFTVDLITKGGSKITFTGSATTDVQGAVEWLFLSGVGLMAGGRALERYLRRRRKCRAEAPDSLDVQSS
jgi:hypothetical protein